MSDLTPGKVAAGVAAEAATLHLVLCGCGGGSRRVHNSGRPVTSSGTQDLASAAPVDGTAGAAALASLTVQMALYRSLVKTTALHSDPKLVQLVGALGKAFGVSPPRHLAFCLPASLLAVAGSLTAAPGAVARFTSPPAALAIAETHASRPAAEVEGLMVGGP